MNEPTVWFCPDCGTISELLDRCCPDWIRAREVPKNFALTCQETFKHAYSNQIDDSKRLSYLIENRAYVAFDATACDGCWLEFISPSGEVLAQIGAYETPRAAIDAARANITGKTQ